MSGMRLLLLLCSLSLSLCIGCSVSLNREPTSTSAGGGTSDTTAPSSTAVSIDSGVQATASSSVTLTLSASDENAIEMCVAEDSTCTSCSYETYSATKSMTLTSGYGLVTVSAKFKDASGNVSGCVTDTIYYEQVAVNPLYSIAPDWNDYAKQTDTTQACNGAESTSTIGCFHGGERKRVTTTETSCTGLTLADNLGVFDWTCSVVGSVAVFDSKFKKGKYLSDLINGGLLTWRDMQVTLTGGSGGTSISRTWWSNTLTALPDNSATSVQTLSTAGTIYVLNSSRNTYGYNIGADRIGIVVMPTYKLTMAAATNNCNQASGETAAADSVCVVSAGSQYFLWFEGAVDGADISDFGVYYVQTKFSKMMNVKAENSNDAGVGTRGSERVYVLDAKVFNNNTRGMMIYNSNYVVVNNAQAYDNTSAGLSFYNGSYNTSVDSVTASNEGVGFEFKNTTSNIVAQLTSMNNASASIYFDTSDSNILHQAVSMNGSSSLTMGSSSTNTVSQLAVQRPISLTSSSNNKFTGNLVFSTAAACSETGGTNPGLTDTTCANNGTSNANLVASLAFTSSFVGKTSSDSSNSSDTAGAAAFASVTDWTSFENFYRVWGEDGSAFAAADHRGACTAGTCRIWDWSIATGDTKLKNKSDDASTSNDAFVSGAACPTEVNGNITVTDGTSTWLKNAVEIVNDNIGDDDGLCESSETCLYTPNFGAYQGHGTLNTCTFSSSGGLTGITMSGYNTNGL